MASWCVDVVDYRQLVATHGGQRVYGILADYEDQNDHDTLRSDPVFKLLAGRLPDGDDLASQPTLSRFENAVTWPAIGTKPSRRLTPT